MKRYEIAYASADPSEGKRIVALVCEPDRLGPATGALLVTHGWGPNRFQHQDSLEWAVERFDLVGIAVEYRQSGYEADPVRGYGWTCPYDASFYQVFDVAGLHEVVIGAHAHSLCS